MCSGKLERPPLSFSSLLSLCGLPPLLHTLSAQVPLEREEKQKKANHSYISITGYRCLQLAALAMTCKSIITVYVT